MTKKEYDYVTNDETLENENNFILKLLLTPKQNHSLQLLRNITYCENEELILDALSLYYDLIIRKKNDTAINLRRKYKWNNKFFGMKKNYIKLYSLEEIGDIYNV